MASGVGGVSSTEKIAGEICEGESSESEAEADPGKPFHRRISTNKEIKCAVSNPIFYNKSLKRCQLTPTL